MHVYGVESVCSFFFTISRCFHIAEIIPSLNNYADARGAGLTVLQYYEFYKCLPSDDDDVGA